MNYFASTQKLLGDAKSHKFFYLILHSHLVHIAFAKLNCHNVLGNAAAAILSSLRLSATSTTWLVYDGWCCDYDDCITIHNHELT